VKTLTTAAFAFALFVISAGTASAFSFTIVQCADRAGIQPCNPQGGTITGDLSVDVNGNVVIVATNNLASGAITELGFGFSSFNLIAPEMLVSFMPLVGTVSGPGGGPPAVNVAVPPFPLQFCCFVDLSVAFAREGTNAWAPGETIRVVLNTDPDLPPGLLPAFGMFAGAHIEGACEASNPAPCLANGGIGGPQSFGLQGWSHVPDGGTTLSLLGLAMVGLVAARRRLY
jgi:hypothetical protein